MMPCRLALNAISECGRAGMDTFVGQKSGFPHASCRVIVERWVNARSLGCTVRCVFSELISTADEKALRLEFLFDIFR